MTPLIDEAKKLASEIEPTAFHIMSSEAAIHLREFLVKLTERVEAQQKEIEQLRVLAKK